MVILGETVGGRFRPFCFSRHSFSQITKQLRRTFVPRRAGRREYVRALLCPVASKEDAGLPDTKRRDSHKPGETAALRSNPLRRREQRRCWAKAQPLRVNPLGRKKRGSTPLQSEDGGVKPPLQRLDHNHENQQNQRHSHLETTRRCSGATAGPQCRRTRSLFTSSAA